MSEPYYQRDGITIWHGDCRDVCEDLPERSVDLLLTDPPYGMAVLLDSMGKTGKFGDAVAGDGTRQGMRLVRGMLGSVAPALAVDAHAYLFCHGPSYPDFVDALAPRIPLQSVLIWWKNRGAMGDCEMTYARDIEFVCFAAHGRRPLQGRRDGSVLSGFAPPPLQPACTRPRNP